MIVFACRRVAYLAAFWTKSQCGQLGCLMVRAQAGYGVEGNDFIAKTESYCPLVGGI